MYDLDCVDDQHSHGKSVGKYHMVIRIKAIDVPDFFSGGGSRRPPRIAKFFVQGIK